LKKETIETVETQEMQREGWFLSPNAEYDSVHRKKDTPQGRRACTAGTRVDVLDKILAWANDSSSECAPIYWINGLAGTGKSTIAYTVCESLQEEGLLAASFFCSRQEEDTRSERYIVPTIVVQLANHSSSYARELRHVSASSIRGTGRQMPDLFVKPWRAVLQERPSTLRHLVIVVDALDENEGGTSFLRKLVDATNKNKAAVGRQKGGLLGLKFLVTSRPHPHIVHVCQDIRTVCHLHSLHRAVVSRDIHKYLKTELLALCNHPIIDTIARQAGSLFIYAATAVRLAKPHTSSMGLSSAEMLARLDVFTNMKTAEPGVFTTDDLYKFIVGDALTGLEPEAQRIRFQILQAILVSEPTSPETIAELLMVDASTVISTVESFHAVLHSPDGTIRWYHASFPDAIFDDRRFHFLIPPPAGKSAPNAILFRSVEVQHSLIAHHCFRVMESELHCHTIKTSSEDQHAPPLALQYSIRSWVTHTHACSRLKLDAIQFNTLCSRLQTFLWQRFVLWMNAAVNAQSSRLFFGLMEALQSLQAWARRVKSYLPELC
jgi:hypothetical protein